MGNTGSPKAAMKGGSMTDEQATSLCNRWIAAERQYRAQVTEARAAGTPCAAMLAHADQLAECRRELQRAASFVVKPEGTG